MSPGKGIGILVAVAVLAGITWLLVDQPEEPADPKQPPNVMAGWGRNPDRLPAPGPGDGGVPTVLGYSEKQAAEVLTAAGFEVTIQRSDQLCLTVGRAQRTVPSTGLVPADGAVRLVVADDPGGLVDCGGPLVSDSMWRLLDFAREVGPAPTFARQPAVYVDGERRSDPDAALELFAQAADLVRAPQSSAQSWQVPRVEALLGEPPTRRCGVRRPEALAGRTATTVTIGFRDDGCPFTLDLYLSTDRLTNEPRTMLADPFAPGTRIDAIVVHRRQPDRPIRTIKVPAVTGLDSAAARQRLIDAGFVVWRATFSDGCDSDDHGLELHPASGSKAKVGTTVTIVRKLCTQLPNRMIHACLPGAGATRSRRSMNQFRWSSAAEERGGVSRPPPPQQTAGSFHPRGARPSPRALNHRRPCVTRGLQ